MNWKYQLLAAAAALSLGACSTDDTCTEPENGGYKISFTVAEDSETRTTLETLDKGDFLRWVSTDQIGIYTIGQNANSNILTRADVDQHPVAFVGTLEQSVSSGDLFYAYYPYHAAQSSDPSAVKLSIPAEQTQTEAGVYNGESHPLVALPMKFSQEWSNSGNISGVRFRQLGAIVELQLYSSDEALRSEKIHSVTFESETPLAGDFSFDMKTVTVKEDLPISGYESKVATTLLEDAAVIPATKDEAARIYLTIAPGQYMGQIVVETDAAQYTFRLAKAITFKRAVIKGLPADLATAAREIISDVPIRFKDSEVKRICVEKWDTDNDGELSHKEAAAVTSIESALFKGKSISSFNELRYFTGLQSIGASAFRGCSSLTSITIPDGVTKIGNYVFSECSSLTSIHIPDGVTTIGGNAFRGCSSLTSINIPDGVTAIEGYTFTDCSSLTSIHIPDGVTSIGKYAFRKCSGLKSIHFPDKLITIEEHAFSNCDGLTSIHLPDGLKTINKSGFSVCKNLKSVHLPEGVTTIADRAFVSCSSLTSINLPKGVTKIELSTFAGCSSLTNITIPDGVTAIGVTAFSGCSSLTSINIPQTVSSIGGGSFGGCTSLAAFEGKYASADHRCLIQDDAFLAFAPANLTEYTIPAGVTSIGNHVFMDCSNLTSITIPDGVTAIGNNAFYGCSSLPSIQIPDGVTAIGDYIFKYCSSLTSINIPDGVTAIGQSAFEACSSLTSVYCKPNTPPTLGADVFSKTPSTMKIYVPTASVNAYKAAWSSYESRIVADDSLPGPDETDPIYFEDSVVEGICLEHWDTNGDGKLSYKEAATVKSFGTLFKGKSIGSFNELQYFTGLQSIGSRVFEGCSSLTSINIPDGVTSIGSSAFEGCNSLMSIIIPDGVTSIGSSAFEGCNSLTSINIPDGVTRIGWSTFEGCNSLTSINIPDGVTKIEASTFSGCSSLTSINIPNGVTAIGAFAFRDCSSLTSITIPDGVTAIGQFAFWGCSNLTSINIPDGVTSIERSTFDDCSSLKSVRIPDGVTSIGDQAFANCRSLTSINIPQTLSTVGRQAFAYCSSLYAFEGAHTSADHRCLILDGALLAFAPAGLTEYTILDKVITIDGAFDGCSNLTSITIPDGVTVIGHDAFACCSSLTSIHIPEGVTSIGDLAFYQCSSLTSITIPEGVTSIGESTFSRCSSLMSVYCKPIAPPILGDYAFNYTTSSIYVPAASVDAYKTAEKWSSYASQIVADNN